MMLEKITKTIKMINWNHGYGELLGVVMDSDWKGGTATIKRTNCLPETRRFQFDLEKGTVRFAGHQRSIHTTPLPLGRPARSARTDPR